MPSGPGDQPPQRMIIIPTWLPLPCVSTGYDWPVMNMPAAFHD
jgi:hypothetical protein